jgi:hypothetical protein
MTSPNTASATDGDENQKLIPNLIVLIGHHH